MCTVLYMYCTVFSPPPTVAAILKKNFASLCHCLPANHSVTVERLKRHGILGDQLKCDLDRLPTVDERNTMILVILIRPIQNDVHMLTFCDVLEDVVENNDSKKFIHNFRSGKENVVFVYIMCSYT